MFSGISIWQLVILLLLIVLLFGTKKLRNLGSDLGEAIKGFRKSYAEKSEEDLEKDKLVHENKAAPEPQTEPAKTSVKEETHKV